MRKILGVLLVIALAGTLPSHPANAADGNVFGTSTVVVAVLDTGVRPTHQEFTYVGPNDTTDQFVGWWDFTADKAAAHRPTGGQVWDTTVWTPYDNHGHGTGTASMAVGKNVYSGKSLSFCPNCKLAVGKVLSGNGSGALADVAAAVYWATDDVHADVISMSLGGAIGGVGPAPGALDVVDEAIQHARDAGVLVVVAAGNGYLDAGIAGMWSELYPESYSTNALVVGGLTSTGTWSASTAFSEDPEVTAHGISVTTAYATGNASYVTWSGTSFATPQVAGMAARLLTTAVAGGCSATPSYLETLLKFGAADKGYPYTLQGFGFLDATQFTALNSTYAPTCTLPPRPLADVSKVYDEQVAGNLRFVSDSVVDSSGDHAWVLTGASATTGSGVLGPSVPAGLAEAEVWHLSLLLGQKVTITAAYTGTTTASAGVNDFDMYLFPPGAGLDGVYGGLEFVASSAQGSGVTESITYQATQTGVYDVLVAGWSVAEPQSYSLTATAGTLTFGSENLEVGLNGPV